MGPNRNRRHFWFCPLARVCNLRMAFTSERAFDGAQSEARSLVQ